MRTFPNLQYAMGWLAGMIDGEGSVFHSKSKKHRGVRIVNTDIGIVSALQVALKMICVPHTVTVFQPRNPKYFPLYTICISSQEGIRKLAQKMTLQHQPKHAGLKALPSTYTTRKFDADRLKQLYLVEKRSQPEIAAILGCSHWHIRHAIQKYQLQKSRHFESKHSFRRKFRTARSQLQSAEMKAYWEERKLLEVSTLN